MVEWITQVNNTLNGIVWGWPALILLAFVGVLTSCITKFFQISHLGHWMKHTIGAIFHDSEVTSHTTDRSRACAPPWPPPWARATSLA